MNCLLLRCILEGLYLTGGITAPITHASYEGAWCGSHYCKGPLGIARIGSEIDLSRSLTLDAGVEHVSYIQEDDRGEERITITLTWRPFR